MPSRHRRSWSVAGLGALIVLNVVLVGLLVLRPAPVAEERATSYRPTATETATAAPEKQEPAELPTEAGERAQAAPAERLIVNADATTAWRVEKGQCEDSAALERTTDGGATWEALSVDLAPVSRLRVLGPQTLFAIGGGDDCDPTYVSSSSGGSSWLTNDQYLEGSWYIAPSDRSIMATPAGQLSAPCEPVELAALDAASAAVLCTDGTLALTADGGASWENEVPDISAAAIGVADDGYVLAGSHEACEDGIAVAALETDGDALEEPSCAPAEAGSLAVSGVADTVWLWVDNEVYVSTDSGQSW
ncbi:hypothetical protein SAMN05216184_1242 [Georgenia satyanarayanai]|uniref:Photosynthesis system II assembly factor Ycf48/Hcf136-like domain-containing protein n=1 Tax=Georgenia satyanarayanai TaxID=860221 RepID=A0A2Y9AV88_9MICO|nr:hypothetical protein [Georgenia satyanarayanai]PYF95937.1 hypothetical protein A8987_1242 [Georgenia satyanarayanai]SSA47258.1 hypothetical protein SAMN05216184_1242 [Georgenia satyanarayanai]